MKKIKKKVLIFDLDGVLIDSKVNMHKSWKVVQQKHSLEKIPFSKYFRHIGRPFKDILKILGVNKKFNEIKITYKKASLKNQKYIKFYSNAIRTLEKLKKNNFYLCILTSKDLSRTKKFLGSNINCFSIVLCDDNKTKGKPHPDKINAIIKNLKVNKKDCVYIGDTHVDYLTAKNSKIDFIFSEWGYGKNYNYKYKCKRISDLEKIIN